MIVDDSALNKIAPRALAEDVVKRVDTEVSYIEIATTHTRINKI